MHIVWADVERRLRARVSLQGDHRADAARLALVVAASAYHLQLALATPLALRPSYPKLSPPLLVFSSCARRARFPLCRLARGMTSLNYSVPRPRANTPCRVSSCCSMLDDRSSLGSGMAVTWQQHGSDSSMPATWQRWLHQEARFRVLFARRRHRRLSRLSCEEPHSSIPPMHTQAEGMVRGARSAGSLRNSRRRCAQPLEFGEIRCRSEGGCSDPSIIDFLAAGCALHFQCASVLCMAVASHGCRMPHVPPCMRRWCAALLGSSVQAIRVFIVASLSDRPAGATRDDQRAPRSSGLRKALRSRVVVAGADVFEPSRDQGRRTCPKEWPRPPQRRAPTPLGAAGAGELEHRLRFRLDRQSLSGGRSRCRVLGARTMVGRTLGRWACRSPVAARIVAFRRLCGETRGDSSVRRLKRSPAAKYSIVARGASADEGLGGAGVGWGEEGVVLWIWGASISSLVSSLCMCSERRPSGAQEARSWRAGCDADGPGEAHCSTERV